MASISTGIALFSKWSSSNGEGKWRKRSTLDKQARNQTEKKTSSSFFFSEETVPSNELTLLSVFKGSWVLHLVGISSIQRSLVVPFVIQLTAIRLACHRNARPFPSSQELGDHHYCDRCTFWGLIRASKYLVLEIIQKKIQCIWNLGFGIKILILYHVSCFLPAFSVQITF